MVRPSALIALSLALVFNIAVPAQTLADPADIPAAEPAYAIKPIAELRLKQLPAGPLYWIIEKLPTLTLAQQAAGPTSLAADVDGKGWLFTLGPKGSVTPGAERVAEIGPVPTINASEYLLRVNLAGGPPGAKTPVHSHPGSEAFYVLNGELGQKTPQGVMSIATGQSMSGHEPGMPMQVYSAGHTNLRVLVLFVVDAAKPFSSPAKFE